MMSSFSNLRRWFCGVGAFATLQSLPSVIICGALLCVTAGGIGCQKSEPTVAKEPVKDRISPEPVKILPFASNGATSYSKPGHLIQTKQKIAANHADESLVLNYSQRAAKTMPGFLPHSNVIFSRSATIAKKESKNVEASIYLLGYPGEDDAQQSSLYESAQINTEILDRNLGTTIGVLSERVRMMQDYQSSMIILADNIDTQSFWVRSSVVEWPFEAGGPPETKPFICIPINSADIKDNFPSSFYGLSTASTIYWDDVSANELNDQQKEAILDWLNFGGRIIINGPQTIGSLSNSFLSPYLPLTNLVATSNGVDELAATLDRFTIDHAANTSVSNSELSPSQAEPVDEAQKKADEVQAKLSVRIANVDGSTISSGLCTATLSASGSWVPQCNGLLAESQVGKGRICMSTFDLTGAKITNWNSYGSFLHSAAFRLPSRTWSPNNGSPSYVFVGDNGGQERNLASYSSVRNGIFNQGDEVVLERNGSRKDLQTDAFQSKNWSESKFKNLALENIQSTTGIKVPPVDSLVKMIGVYLLVLVPANWCVFRLFNRLEWAWFLIPMIAVSSAAIFAYTLQIQIGFARSQNSIGWLQLENGFHRASLSRQISIYTSLSSRFRLSLPSDQGFVLPNNLQALSDSGISQVSYVLNDEYGSGIRNHPIRSHTSVLFQSNELVDVGGAFDVSNKDSSPRIENNSNLQLQDTIWIRKRNNEKTYHWIGPFSPGSQINLADAKAYSSEAISNRLSESISENVAIEPHGSVNDQAVRQMIRAFLESNDNSDSSDYLVGWTRNMVSRLVVAPEPAQKNDVTLVSLKCDWKLGKDVEKDRYLPPENLHARRSP